MILLWFVFHDYVTQALFLGLTGLQVCWPLATKVYQYANTEVFQKLSSTKVPEQATKNFILINPPRCILLALGPNSFSLSCFLFFNQQLLSAAIMLLSKPHKDQCRQSGTKHNLGPFNNYVLPQVTLGISADLSKEDGWRICAKIQLFRE